MATGQERAHAEFLGQGHRLTVIALGGLGIRRIEAAQDLGATQLQIFGKVVIPGALPNIFTGLRLAAGTALILVFITEMEATKAGLGFLLWESHQLLLVKEVFTCTIAFGVLGILATGALQGTERLVCPWRRV